MIACSRGYRVRHLLSTVGRASMGLGPVALNLVREQRALGIDAQIWCLDNPSEIEWASESSGLRADCIVGYPRIGPSFLGLSSAMERAISGAEGRNIDVVHQHGIWTGISIASNRWRKKFHRPTVIAPHGSLEQWALRRSAWKKRIALVAYEAKNIEKAACLHATTYSEAQGFRAYGSNNPVAIIQNGISDKWIEGIGDGVSFQIKYGLPEGRRLMLYVGRITPVKNLSMFIEAMSKSKEALQDWLLVIVGKDEFGYQREVKEKVRRLKLEPWVKFVGFLSDQDKRNAYDASEIFILPSYREAAPIVILEALGAAVPVLTTQGVPWEDLETYQCGWRPAIGIDSISRSLKEAISKSTQELSAMGQRGLQLIYERYRWAYAARRTLSLYEWLLGRAGQPEFILKG